MFVRTLFEGEEEEVEIVVLIVVGLEIKIRNAGAGPCSELVQFGPRTGGSSKRCPLHEMLKAS